MTNRDCTRLVTTDTLPAASLIVVTYLYEEKQAVRNRLTQIRLCSTRDHSLVIEKKHKTYMKFPHIVHKKLNSCLWIFFKSREVNGR